jgi:plastocyanin
MRAGRTLIIGAVAVAFLAACGDDDDNTAATTAAPAPSTTGESTSATSAEGSTPGSASGSEGTLPVPDEICALAKQMDEQDDFPSDAQLQKYKDLAPDAIKDDVNKAAGALLEAGDDMVAKFNAFGSDDIEPAIAKIDAWEEANCGIKHSEEDAMPPGSSKEIEDAAAKVEVTAREYSFDMPDSVKAGRTSFVLSNKGQEAHVMAIVKLKEGAILDQVLQSDDEAQDLVETEWSSDIAASGEEEALTFDVTPGTYGVVCFIPNAQGQPHVMLGMHKEFTVS